MLKAIRSAARMLPAGIFLIAVGSAHAEDLAKELMNALFSQMAGAYVCRDALGGLAQYQAAETIATGSLQLIGMSNDQAVLLVDKMAKKFEADTRVIPNDTSHAQACQERLTEGLRQIEVVTAKLRTAG